eukprot:9043366-Pyramimonas_sp.AAC.1
MVTTCSRPVETIWQHVSSPLLVLHKVVIEGRYGQREGAAETESPVSFQFHQGGQRAQMIQRAVQPDGALQWRT